MVQVFGKALNNKKKAQIALKTVLGLNEHQVKLVCNDLNIGKDCKISDLSQSHMISLLKVLEQKNFVVESGLKKEVRANKKRLIEIKTQRGLRSIRKRFLHN